MPEYTSVDINNLRKCGANLDARFSDLASVNQEFPWMSSSLGNSFGDDRAGEAYNQASRAMADAVAGLHAAGIQHAEALKKAAANYAAAQQESYDLIVNQSRVTKTDSL